MYAYLEIARGVRDRVRFSDGSTDQVVAAGQGARVAEEWQDGFVTARSPAFAEEQERIAAVNRQAAEAFEVEHATWRRGLDLRLEATISVSHAQQLRAEYTSENPEPVFEPLSATHEPAEPNATANVTEEPWWFATLHSEGTSDITTLTNQAGYPRAAVAAELSRHEVDGWAVVDVSETRAVHHANGQSSAYVTGAWFLLRRLP